MKISKNRLKEIIIEEISNLAELEGVVPEEPEEEVELTKTAARSAETTGGSAVQRAREVGGMTPREGQIVAIMQQVRKLLAAQGEVPAAATIRRYVQAALAAAQKQTGKE